MQHYRFAGSEGSDCYCGNMYGRYGPSISCNIKCSGDVNKRTFCGGEWALTVVSTGLCKQLHLISSNPINTNRNLVWMLVWITICITITSLVWMSPLCGDIHTNPGPPAPFFSLCIYNIRSLLSNDHTSALNDLIEYSQLISIFLDKFQNFPIFCFHYST